MLLTPFRMNALSGYRTYIIAALLGLLAAGHYLGYIDLETFQSLSVMLTGGGLAALRAGVKNG